MAEFLERLTSGRTVLLIAVAVVLVLRLSSSQVHHRGPAAAALESARVARDAGALPATFRGSDGALAFTLMLRA
jgi:hypothetical protein